MTSTHRTAVPSVDVLSTARSVRLAAAGLSLIAVCYGLARFAYGLFVPAFREAFGLDAATAGAIASGSYVAYGVGILAATALTPRVGARVVSVAAGVLATAGTTLIALSPGAAMLTVGVLVAGSSTGVASPPLAHAIALRVAPRARNRIQTIVNAGTGAGVLVSGPIALLTQEQWRAAWLTFAALAAVVTVWAAVTVPAARETTTAPPDRGRRSPRELLPHGSARLLGAAGVMGAASAATWTFGQDLLTNVGRHSPSLSTVAWIVLGACGLFGAAAGDAADRLGLRTAWTTLMVALSVTTATVAAAPHLFVVALIATGVFGAVYIALTGVLLVWSTRLFALHPARGVGLAFLFIAVGQAVAAPALGAVADHTTLTAAFWLAAVLALVGARHGPVITAGRDRGPRR